MDAAESRHDGIVECHFSEVLQDARFKPAGNLAVGGRADGRDVVVDGMIR